jgi:hypothetical protein
MDIRQAPAYINWKTRVESTLYEFQLAQSNKAGTTAPYQRTSMPTLQEGYLDLGDIMPDENEWERIGLDMPSDVVCAVGLNAGPKQFLDLNASTTPLEKMVQPTNTTMGTIIQRTKKTHVMVATMLPGPSKVNVFMQSRPGGHQETVDNEMKVVERRISSQLQKKGTTSAQGRHALAEIATTMATVNKENEPAAQAVNKRKSQSGPAIPQAPIKKVRRKLQHQAKSTQKIAKSAKAQTNTAKLWPVIACKYGCQHGGLLELVQMIPKNTKYHLGRGNYFHNKSCKDCNGSIGDMFEKSKNKAIFYYCHMDNKVFDLRDDDLEKEATACACILCLPCYYRRDENKKLVSGKSTRSSGRGRG